MNRIQRCLAALAGLGGALLALTVTAPAAFARLPAPGPASPSPRPLPPDWYRYHPHLPPGHIHQPVHLPPAPVPVHTIISGGMPGWQITLIAAGAALLGAVLAVLAGRAWAARRATTSAT
jgi:hypothetical protein